MKKPAKALTSILLTVLFAVSVFTPAAGAQELNQLTDLPAIHITLDDNKNVNSITKNERLPATVSVRAEGYDDITGVPITIKGRGNSTWTLPKKPYQIKFDEKTDMLGMGAAKKWILLANYWDKTLMRNAVTYDLANKINNIWSVEFRFADVYINGEYRGNYLLTEKIEFGKQRINEDGEKGAVLLELEQQYRHAGEGCSACIITDSGVHATLKEPELGKPYTTEEFKAIKQQTLDKLNRVEAAIHEGYDSYSQFIDVRSFIDWYIENELAKNYDAAFVTSTYCYLDESGLLHMGPVWDVDVCFGNQDVTYPGTVDNGLNTYNYRSDKGAWYMSLFDDEDFVRMLKERWSELKTEGYIYGMLDKIDELYAQIKDSQKHDNAVWPDAMQVTNVRGKGTPYFSFDKEVTYFKDWLSQRIEWLDSQWNDDYCTILNERRMDSMGGGGIKTGIYGSVENGIWSWDYLSAHAPNSPVVTSKTFFDGSIKNGKYICSVNYKAEIGECTDYLMLRLIGVDKTGRESVVSQTSATHVSYVTAQKDAEGYAKLNMKLDTTQNERYVSYKLVIDAYNADVMLKNIFLYADLVKGDVVADGTVTASDALLTLQNSVGKVEFSQTQATLADVDGSKGITAGDALLILQKAVGKLESFPSEDI